MTNEVKNVPQLRFPNFDGEWEEKQLGDVTKTNQGLQIAISDRKTKYEKELYFYITNEFLRPNSQTKYYIENPPESVVAEKSDILMTRTGNTGKVITNVEGAFHNNFFKIKYNKSIIDRLFLFELLKSPKVNNKFLSLAGTSTIPDLNHSDFYSVYISFPTISEQQKIGEFFSKLDRQIELGEQKLENLEEQKKGYMQQIFSQKLRFKDDNGNYYAEWKEKNLGDISELITKGTTPKNKVNDGSINFIKVENISPINGFITNTTKITEEEHSTYLKRSQLKENDILFSIAGTLGRVSVVKREILPANTNQALAIIRLNAMNLEYIKTYLTGRAIKRFIANNPTVGAQPNMSLTQIRDLIIAIPNLTEQEKIGSFFKKIDNSIKKQSDKIWLLKKRKKGFLQKMFV